MLNWGMGKEEQWTKQKKGGESFPLSISELSEFYLCQTPTILSGDPETASRTSGCRGKLSRTLGEVWRLHWMRQAKNAKHTCAFTETQKCLNTYSAYTSMYLGTHKKTLQRQTQRQALTPSDIVKLSRLHKADIWNAARVIYEHTILKSIN